MAETTVTSAGEELVDFMRKFVQSTEDRDNGRNGKTKDDYGWDFLKVRVAEQETDERGTFDAARKLENIQKNRYRDIIPYDHTRVKLEIRDGFSGDYINASYIKGADERVQYIATMGPQHNTIEDFWRMVIDNKSTVIVMLCPLQEGDKIKCDRYWPLKGDKMTVAKCTISLMTEEIVNDNYIRRHLRVQPASTSKETDKKNGSKEAEPKDKTEFIVHQLQYTDWPDYGRPEKVEPMLEMIDEMRQVHGNRGPIIVHCSAGCGRTGAIVAVDIAQQMLKTGRMSPKFSISDLVIELRKQRPAMVQSLDQYILVNHAIAELFRRQLKITDAHHYVNVEGYRNKPSANGDKKEEPRSNIESKDATVKLGNMVVKDYPNAPSEKPHGPQPMPTEFGDSVEHL